PALTTSAIQSNAVPGTSGTDESGNPTNTVAASLVVQAHDAFDLFNLAGGITSADNAGVGAAVSYDSVTRDTEAFIGDGNGAAGNGTSATVVSGGNVIVDARNSGTLGTLALAAAKVSSNSGSGGGSGQNGIGISGDVSFNQVTDTTLAYLHDAQ